MLVVVSRSGLSWICSRTDHHNIEVETLANTLAVPLVGQIGESNIAGKLAANNVLHIASGLGNGLRVTGADSLGDTLTHRVAALNERRLLAATGRGGVVGRDGGTIRRWRRS